MSYIVAATRSPIGKAFKGSFTELRGDDLCARIVRAALDQLPDPDAVAKRIEDVVVGCAQPAGEQGYNLGRAVSLLAGLQDVPGATVNRYCSSSLQAIRMAHHAIAAGEGDVFIAAGVECVSRFKFGKADGMEDTKNARFLPGGGLPQYYLGMGLTAENVADARGVTREAQDAFAARSQQRAVLARESGVFAAEITPIETSAGAIAHDDCPRAGTTAEKLAGLRTVFRDDGTVTAGNCCPLNDGAAAVVVMSEAAVREFGLTPRARIVSTAVTALNPELMGLGPIESSRRALARAGLTMADMDVVEINEAFAAQVIPCAESLEIPEDRLNVHGGAIALGHPFGMTGARIAVTLLNALERRGGRYGLETMCVGGGQGMAMVIERL
jgi:acetyl-CoA C-acetyltransferase